jgi:hypothetical protein
MVLGRHKKDPIWSNEVIINSRVTGVEDPLPQRVSIGICPALVTP